MKALSRNEDLVLAVLAQQYPRYLKTKIGISVDFLRKFVNAPQLSGILQRLEVYGLIKVVGGINIWALTEDGWLRAGTGNTPNIPPTPDKIEFETPK